MTQPVTHNLLAQFEANASLKKTLSSVIDSPGIDQELSRVDSKMLLRQLSCLHAQAPLKKDFQLFDETVVGGHPHRIKVGKSLAKEGRCAALLLAGGQGSRLGHCGPKGTFPLPTPTPTTLFEVFSKKFKKACDALSTSLPLAIMTSPLNDDETRTFFKKHHYFGLDEEQVYFFKQEMLPLLDYEGRLFLEKPGMLAMGPNGNGDFLKNFFKSGIGARWKKQGIEYITTSLIDNILASPLDFELIGHLYEQQLEIALKSCQRTHPQEKVGVIVKDHSQLKVIEYHELPKELTFDKEPMANLSLMSFSMSFAERVKDVELPMHIAAKKAAYFDPKLQQTLKPLKPNAWKFETYLFDLLPFSNKVSVFEFERKEVFLPLKDPSNLKAIAHQLTFGKATN